MIIQKVKQKWYTDRNTVNYHKDNGYWLQLLKRKPVLSGIYDNRLYSEYVTEIIVEESDKEKILARLKDNVIGKTVKYIIIADIMRYISGSLDMAKEEYAFCDERYERVWCVDKPGFESDEPSKRADTFTFYVVDYNDLKPLPLTKQEQEKLKVIKEKEARRKLNAATIATTMIDILNNSGYDVGNTRDSGVYYKSIKGYNKLMKDALEYYLNDKIFKGMNVEITTPKVKNQHKYGYNDNLFNFSDVIIKE